MMSCLLVMVVLFTNSRVLVGFPCKALVLFLQAPLVSRLIAANWVCFIWQWVSPRWSSVPVLLPHYRTRSHLQHQQSPLNLRCLLLEEARESSGQGWEVDHWQEPEVDFSTMDQSFKLKRLSRHAPRPPSAQQRHRTFSLKEPGHKIPCMHPPVAYGHLYLDPHQAIRQRQASLLLHLLTSRP